MKKLASSTLLALIVPYVAFAQRTFSDVVDIALDLIQTAIPIVMTMALVVFFWGAAKLISTAGDDQSRSQGKQALMWGIIALFAMASIWGIVRIIQVTFIG